MKKLFLSAACALTLFAAACSGSNDKQAARTEAEKMIEEYTAKVENAQTINDLLGIHEDFKKDAEDFNTNHPDFPVFLQRYLVVDAEEFKTKHPDFEVIEALREKAEKLEDSFEKKIDLIVEEAADKLADDNDIWNNIFNK